MAGTLPEAAQTDILNNLITNLLTGAKMGLMSSAITPGTGTTLANCTAVEATFTGYARSSLTAWSAVTVDGTTASVTTSTTAQFTPTGGGGSGNLYGYFLTDTGGTKFYGVEEFAGGPASVPQNVTYEVDVTFSTITRF